MKYLKLFEQFEEGHKFDILDLYLMELEEVKELFFKELRRTPPDLENIQVFLDSGLVDFNTKGDTNNEWMPLEVAVANNLLEVTQFLISYGADVNLKGDGGWMPLHFAARNNSLELAELLISSGADVNAKKDDSYTPLRVAAINGHQKMAELLQSHGGIQ